MTRAAIQFAGILAILIGVGAASLVAPGLVFVAAAEGYFQDLRIAFLSARPGAQDTRVSVVSITEKTLAGLPYRSPVSRGFLADLLIAVDRAGAKAIAFDIFFDQATVPEQDAALIAAIRGARAPVAAATFLDRTTQTAAQRAFQDTFIRDSQALKGYADLPLDGDGVVRAHPDSLSPTETSLSAALVESTGFDASRSRGQIAWRRAHKAGEAAFQVLPAQLVIQMSGLNPGLVETWLGGRLVLIGADLPIDDQFRTPLNIDLSMGQTTAGVIVHAQAALQLLDGIALRRASRAEHFWILAVLGLAAAGLAFLRAPALLRSGAVLLIMVGFWLVAAVIFRQTNVLVPMLVPSAHLLLIYGLTNAVHGAAAARQKRLIRVAFSHYLSPVMVARLAKDPERLKLGGDRRQMTFIFSDIAGFTTMSEGLRADELVPLLNAYLDGMSQVVLEHEGTIDKFIGDAVVAFFGAPDEQPDHVARAVRCAIAMDAFGQSFMEQHAALGFGITRIGVHTGPASVGNFGGPARFDYTAMGDTVNTAARLEALNKHLGTRVCVSGAAVSAAQARGEDLPPLRAVGSFVLKGKKEPIEVFEAVSEGTAALADLAGYRSAFDAMASGSSARGMFETLAAERPGDGLVAFHLARLRSGETGAVIVMDEK